MPSGQAFRSPLPDRLRSLTAGLSARRRTVSEESLSMPPSHLKPHCAGRGTSCRGQLSPWTGLPACPSPICHPAPGSCPRLGLGTLLFVPSTPWVTTLCSVSDKQLTLFLVSPKLRDSLGQGLFLSLQCLTQGVAHARLLELSVYK